MGDCVYWRVHEWNGFRPAGEAVYSLSRWVCLWRLGVVLRCQCGHEQISHLERWRSQRTCAYFGTLECLHCRQEPGHCWTSKLMFGQTYFKVMSLFVALMPGCAREYRQSKTSHQKLRGINGLGAPVETSQRQVVVVAEMSNSWRWRWCGGTVWL